jgi:CubicO group peptidase (beta-lactamase class C family)
MNLQTALGLTLGLVFLAGSGCATNPTPPAAQTSLAREGIRDISTTIEPIIARAKIPGMVAVVLNCDRIIAQGAAGVRKRGDSTPITIDDQFLLCSATKAMTATLAAMAVDEGKLSWSSTLGASLPEIAPQMHPDWKTVTLAQLLAHRAGVPATGDSFWNSLRAHFSSASAAEKRRTIVAKTLARAPSYPPGSRYVYADIDYIIVGAMLEAISGRSWEDLIRENSGNRSG